MVLIAAVAALLLEVFSFVRPNVEISRKFCCCGADALFFEANCFCGQRNRNAPLQVYFADVQMLFAAVQVHFTAKYC